MWRTSEYWRQWLSQGTFPDHPWRAYLQSSALALEGPVATRRPVRCSPRRPRRCRKPLAGNGTGTTATPGSGTPPSPCGGCTRWASTARPTTSSSSSTTSAGTTPTICRSCTASAVSGSWRRAPSITSPATTTPGRCGSATAPTTSSSTTSGAPCSTRSTCTPGPASRCRRNSGRSSSPRSSRPPRTGGRPTAASGRCAANRSTSPPRRSCAGWRWTAASGWPGCTTRTTSPTSGRRSPTRSTPTSSTNGVDERGVLVQRYGSDALDASLLLAPLVRFLPPDDPRIRATVLAIADELTHEGLVLRYRVEETDDGLAGEEGTFTICSFWLVSALVEIGEEERARALCERLLVARLHPRAVRRGTRPGHRSAPGQLPAGVHPPGADQRRHPRHPGGGALPVARFRAGQPAARDHVSPAAGELPAPAGDPGYGSLDRPKGTAMARTRAGRAGTRVDGARDIAGGDCSPPAAVLGATLLPPRRRAGRAAVPGAEPDHRSRPRP